MERDLSSTQPLKNSEWRCKYKREIFLNKSRQRLSYADDTAVLAKSGELNGVETNVKEVSCKAVNHKYKERPTQPNKIRKEQNWNKKPKILTKS